ncbi:hypothetical protein V5R04_12920 [Jonesiaceae bacterium BS-20]|uniref:Uncharacterized protein n=1 Tax=Jonesiaceae bacterium BS-20 TaxID=3120821 RepID=A0AAU7DWK2_9MICO
MYDSDFPARPRFGDGDPDWPDAPESPTSPEPPVIPGAPRIPETPWSPGAPTPATEPIPKRYEPDPDPEQPFEVG